MIPQDAIDGSIAATKRLVNSSGLWSLGEELRRDFLKTARWAININWLRA
jgi:hypothetical protein